MIAEALGVPVQHVTTWPRPGVRGTAWFGPWSDVPMDRLVLLLLAGGIAAQRAFPGVELVSDATDLKEARLLIVCLGRTSTLSGSDAVTRALPRWRARAERLVVGHWGWVCRTAEALERWRALTREEVLRLRTPGAMV